MQTAGAMGNWMMYFVVLLAILAFQLLFTTGLGLITRKVSFFYYAGFLVMMIAYNYLRFEPVHHWSVGPDQLAMNMAPAVPFLAYYFYFRFVRFFLDLKRLRLSLDRLARWLEWLSLAYIGAFFLFREAEIIRMISYFAIAGSLAIGTTVLQVRMLRFRSMIIRLVQWGSLFYFLGMMTGYVGRALTTLGHTESKVVIDYMSLGLLIEVTFFSLALAYKLRQEAEEKQQAQEQALHRLREIQSLNGALQDVRDNIARDLHDDIGSTLSTISLLGALAGQQIRPEHPAAPIVQRMGENARSMSEAMNDAIWALNSRNDDAEAFIKRMEDFAAVLLTGAELVYEFEVSPAWRVQVFDMGLRKNLFLIFKEALHNAVRHAGADAVHIRLTEAPGQLRLSIADNGRGLDTGAHVPGNGLRNMRKRAEESGLQLHFYSPHGGGLHIEVAIPLPRLREATHTPLS